MAANTKAMTAVGFLNGQDPPGGQILRDADGAEIGVVLENAQQPLREAAFPNTAENQAIAYESLKVALRELAKNPKHLTSSAIKFQLESISFYVHLVYSQDQDLMAVDQGKI